jgi:hypothetical protein
VRDARVEMSSQPTADATARRSGVSALWGRAPALLLAAGRDLFFVSVSGRSVRRSLVYLAAVSMAVLAPYRGSLALDVSLVPDQHRWMSLDIALNKTFCGEPSALSPNVSTRLALERPFAVSTAFRRMIRTEAGSIDAYCRSLRPYLNNENSLMLLIRGALLAKRNLSPRGLGHVLLLVRIALILCFCYVLLWSGGSVLSCVCTLAAALSLQQDVAQRSYSLYPFLLVLPMAGVALYSAAYRVAVPGRLGAHLLSCALGGWLGAFHANMRTSHLLMVLALFVVYLAITHGASTRLGPRRTRSRKLAWLLGGILAFAAGYKVFAVTFIGPLEAVGPTAHAFHNYSYHAVTHPLVLALATPENDLSRREGIVWPDDGVGFRLAKEMVPSVKYLEPPYERALLLYYIKLWLLYPREMLDIYRVKVAIAGKHMLDTAEHLRYGGPLWAWLLWPLKIVPGGGTLLLIFVMVTAVGAILSAEKGWPLAFVMTLAGAAACMSLLESMATVPFFFPEYHSYLLLAAGLVALLAWQLALEGGRIIALWAASRWRRCAAPRM